MPAQISPTRDTDVVQTLAPDRSLSAVRQSHSARARPMHGDLMLLLTSIKTIRQQRSLEVASRPRHVFGVVDETRRTYRHHGLQRDAPRRFATFHHATLRVAPHRYATREPLGTPGLVRLARTVTLKRLWLRDGHVQRALCRRGIHHQYARIYFTTGTGCRRAAGARDPRIEP